jgi:hypothetical protein
MSAARALRPEAVVEPAPGQVSTDLGDETAILHMESGRYYALDPVASRVWELLVDKPSVERLLDALLEEYEVEREECRHDLDVLLRDLESRRLVVVTEGEGVGF